MIGRVIMDIGKAEMIAIVEHYLNHELFMGRERHKCRVINVRQRNGGRFSIDFQGQPEVVKVFDVGTLETQPVNDAKAATGGGQ